MLFITAGWQISCCSIVQLCKCTDDFSDQILTFCLLFFWNFQINRWCNTWMSVVLTVPSNVINKRADKTKLTSSFCSKFGEACYQHVLCEYKLRIRLKRESFEVESWWSVLDDQCLYKMLSISYLLIGLVQFAGVWLGCNAFEESVYDFSVRELNGDRLISLDRYRDNCLLIVNTASGCSLTSLNMMFLERIGNEEHRRSGLHVIAIPSNSFLDEPRSEPQLIDWFRMEWRATYDIFGLTDLNQSNLYRFLIRRSGSQAPMYDFGEFFIFESTFKSLIALPQFGKKRNTWWKGMAELSPDTIRMTLIVFVDLIFFQMIQATMFVNLLANHRLIKRHPWHK